MPGFTTIIGPEKGAPIERDTRRAGRSMMVRLCDDKSDSSEIVP